MYVVLSGAKCNLGDFLITERAVALLQELALAMHCHDGGRQVQVSRRWAAEAIAAEWREPTAKERLAKADRFLAEEELDSGIVVGRGGEVRFWHLTFQEFLAAKALAGLPEAERRVILFDKAHRLYRTEWREVVMLLAGVLHQLRPAQHVVVAAYVDAGGDESGASALASAAPTREAWARLAACWAVEPAPEPGSLVVRFNAPP